MKVIDPTAFPLPPPVVSSAYFEAHGALSQKTRETQGGESKLILINATYHFEVILDDLAHIEVQT